MLKNVYVRIAVIIVLVILLYYLIIALARGTAGTDAPGIPPEGSATGASAAETRGP
jgi:hypothetical protein